MIQEWRITLAPWFDGQYYCAVRVLAFTDEGEFLREEAALDYWPEIPNLSQVGRAWRREGSAIRRLCSARSQRLVSGNDFQYYYTIHVRSDREGVIRERILALDGWKTVIEVETSPGSRDVAVISVNEEERGVAEALAHIASDRETVEEMFREVLRILDERGREKSKSRKTRRKASAEAEQDLPRNDESKRP